MPRSNLKVFTGRSPGNPSEVPQLGLIPRPMLRQQIERALGRARAVVLTGPRQSGKSTLARTFVPPDHTNYFDLEDPAGRAALARRMRPWLPGAGWS